MALRDYQLQAREAIFNFLFTRHGNPIVCLPTGTGKSFSIADTCYCADYYIPGARVVVATHSQDLVAQNADELRGYWIGANVGVYSASLKVKDDPSAHQFMYVGIDSVYKKPEIFGFVHLLLIDECHLVDATEGTRYAKFIEGLQKANPQLRVIGFSATAWRTKTGALANSGIFTDVCYDGCTMDGYNWFERQGYLARLVGKQTETMIDLSEVRTTNGDYNLNDLELATDERITKLILEESADLGYQRNCWLVYGSTIAHVEMMNEMLNRMGIPSAAVHSKTGINRRQTIQEMKAGKYRALVSQGMLTTGVNIPQVDMIVQARATKSSSLHVQIMGRGTRPVFAPGYDLSTAEGRIAAQAAGPKKDCLIADFARNIDRLGPINDPYIPDGKKKKGGGGGGCAPVRVCEHCKMYSHASKSHCEHCGAPFPVPSKLYGEASNAAPVASAEPVFELFNVSNITYHVHKSKRGGQCIRVTYHAGFSGFTEYVHIEEKPGTQPHRRAIAWLRERGMRVDIPHITVNDVMQQIRFFKEVGCIRVWTNKKYPEIVDVWFTDGTPSTLNGAQVATLKFA